MGGSKISLKTAKDKVYCETSYFFHTVKEETKKQDFWAENKTLLKVELNPSIRIVTTLVGH